MKISYNWLKDYIKFNIEPAKLGEILTDIGLEVEGIETYEEVKGSLAGIVVGEVLSCEKHLNADKLTKTTVNIGGKEPLPIVCGAPNVAVGQKVVVATVGTTLYMGEKSFEIKKAKIRGEESMGMICAEDEIGLGDSHHGIMVLDADALPGTAAAEHFNIQTDTVFEIGLTPNRIDAGSHFGVARDLAAFFSLKNKTHASLPDISNFGKDVQGLEVKVTLKDSNACKRYTGLTITDIKVAPSPGWLQNRLKAIGLKPINNVVDITNFVLHELGQPLHAFDADKLDNKEIVVQKLPAGTKFTTLDEVEHTLTADDLMICDASKPACIGGVFGGIDSGVTDETTSIFLESAYFDPVSVRKSAKHHQLSTDSSFRFERGVDPNITVFALKRTAQLIREIAGGKVSSDITDIYPEPMQYFKIDVSYDHVDRLIGKTLDRGLIKGILTSLEIKITKESPEGLKLEVPPYRVDVTREADIIEDILRLYGYNNVEFSEKLNSSLSYMETPDNEIIVNRISEYMVANGFNEIMSNSLSRSGYYEMQKDYPAEKAVKIVNPLSSDLGVMRQTLIFSGLESIIYNINRKNSNLRLFEYGNCYSLNGKTGSGHAISKYSEDKRIALFLSGLQEEPNWNTAETSTSFSYLKAYVQNIMIISGLEIDLLDITPLENKPEIFNSGLVYNFKGKVLAEIGFVSESLLEQFDIEQEVYFAEIYWDKLLSYTGQTINYKEIPKFPEVRRDLALLIDESVEYQEIKNISEKTERKILKRVDLFDFFKGKNIPAGKKSYGVSFYLQDEKKTLTEKDIDRIMDKITKNLVQQLNAELR